MWAVHSEWNERNIDVLTEEISEESSDEYSSDEIPTKKTVLRYDLVYRHSPNGNGKGKAMAVLEYKRRELIRFKDFEAAMIPDNAALDEIEKSKKTAARRKDKTLLKGNALSYGKQVCAYAARAECRHVALFNWDHLIVFNFDQLRPGVQGIAGTEAKVSWVHESGQGNRFMEIGITRKVLLGWILTAFEDAGIKRC